MRPELSLIEVLREESQVPILIGPSRALVGDVPYVSFVNGVLTPEGSAPLFVGTGLVDAKAKLRDETVRQILAEAEKRGCNSICIRANTEHGVFQVEEATFGPDFDSGSGIPVYRLARCIYRTRVAFLTITQGAYNHG